jgi:hypothetical protein
MMMMTTNTSNNTNIIINNINKYKFNNLHYDPTNLAFLDPLENFVQNSTLPIASWPRSRIQQALWSRP